MKSICAFVSVLVLLIFPQFITAQTPLLTTGNTFIQSLAVSPDGKLIAVEGESGDVALWDLGTRKKSRTLKREQQSRQETEDTESEMYLSGLGSIAFGSAGRFLFSPDGQLLILCKDDGVTAWKVQSAKQFMEVKILPDFYDVAPNGKYIAYVNAAIRENEQFEAADIRGSRLHTDSITIFNTETGAKRVVDVATMSKTNRIRFALNSSSLLVMGVNGGLTQIDCIEGKPLGSKQVYEDDEDESSVAYDMEVVAPTPPSVSVAVHPSKSILAVTDSKQHLYLYDYATGQLLHQIKLGESLWGPGQYFHQLQFSPDGKYLLGAGMMLKGEELLKILQFWDVNTGKEAYAMTSGILSANLCFSPDGKYFAFSKLDTEAKMPMVVCVYETGVFTQKTSFNGRGALAFFPNDSQRLAFLAGNGIGIHTIKP